MKAGMATSPIAMMMTEQYHLVLAALIMARALLEIHATCTVWYPGHPCALCAVNNTRWLAVVGQSLSEALTMKT